MSSRYPNTFYENVRSPNIQINVFQKKLNTKLNLRERLSCKDHEQTNSKNILHFQKKNQLFLKGFSIINH